MNPALAPLGFGAFFQDQLSAAERDQLCGRVSFHSRGYYQVLTDREHGVLAELKGSLRHQARAEPDALPTVGDWVLMDTPSQGRAHITRVLKRRNALSRREQARREAGRRFANTQNLAANVDWGLITTSLNEEWNERRLKRYIGLVSESGAKPAVLLTKTDLAADGGAQALQTTRDLATRLPVLLINAPGGGGLKDLLALLGGQGTAVLLGSSGVGKSTLVNALLGDARMATGPIRESDDHGRHTTAGRHLMPLPEGGCIIDSPGLRDLGLIAESAADAGYDEIAVLAGACRFSDCGHSNEPGCAVRAALERGELGRERWLDYMKLRDEARREEARDKRRKK